MPRPVPTSRALPAHRGERLHPVGQVRPGLGAVRRSGRFVAEGYGSTDGWGLPVMVQSPIALLTARSSLLSELTQWVTSRFACRNGCQRWPAFIRAS